MELLLPIPVVLGTSTQPPLPTRWHRLPATGLGLQAIGINHGKCSAIIMAFIAGVSSAKILAVSLVDSGFRHGRN